MNEFILKGIEEVSLVIGLIGIFIILVGALRGFAQYLLSLDNPEFFQEIRLTLGSHLILGLDFLVCKDIIDTLLLDTGSQFIQDISSLIVIVAIRIILTFFTMKEIQDLKEFQEDKRKKKQKKLK